MRSSSVQHRLPVLVEPRASRGPASNPRAGETLSRVAQKIGGKHVIRRALGADGGGQFASR